jgi:putative transposase
MTKTCYPTNLTDEQWQQIKSYLPKPQKRGRPPVDRRHILNALLYFIRAGCQWRMLPADFGPWQTVYHYYRGWQHAGHWVYLHDRLRALVRHAAGKDARPTAAILDSQTVRSADHTGETGYDAAKKTKGRKRHVLVDTLGLLLAVCVTPASTPERSGARQLLGVALRWLGWLRCLWCDSGYCGPEFAAWVRTQRRKLAVEVIQRRKGQRGFAVLPKRWIVERTFGWFMKQRRLVRDYEVKTEHAEACVYIAMIGIMIRKLA